MGKAVQRNLAGIQLRTVDGFQGGEAPIVLLDLVITDHPGFVREPNRLNVTLTRARDGLIVVTDVRNNELIRDRYK